MFDRESLIEVKKKIEVVIVSLDEPKEGAERRLLLKMIWIQEM